MSAFPDPHVCENGGTYCGAWLDGLKHGQGTFYQSDGSVYDGEWFNDQKSGVGFYYYANGASYKGGFKDNKLHGEGIYNYADGAVYSGRWENNHKNGYGTHTYPNGDVYIGNWVDNKKSGFGEYTYASGATYKGYWRNDDKYGRGIYEYPNGDTYDGDFVRNMHGNGLYLYNNGAFYEGGWIDNRKCGIGKYVYANGDCYIGEWFDSRKEGVGQYIYADGNIREGIWRNDTFAGPARQVQSTSSVPPVLQTPPPPSRDEHKPFESPHGLGMKHSNRRKVKANRNHASVGVQLYGSAQDTANSSDPVLPTPLCVTGSFTPPHFPPHSRKPCDQLRLLKEKATGRSTDGIPTGEIAPPPPVEKSGLTPNPPRPVSAPLKKLESDRAILTAVNSVNSKARKNVASSDECVVCMNSHRDGVIIHGQIAHICCCFSCANLLKASGKACPLCRGPIDTVVKGYSA